MSPVGRICGSRKREVVPWWFHHHPQWLTGGSCTSSHHSSGISSIRSPQIQRSRWTPHYRWLLCSLGSLYPGLIKQKWVTILSQAIDPDQQREVGLLWRDKGREEHLSILCDPLGHLLLLPWQMVTVIGIVEQSGPRREKLSGSETPWGMKVLVATKTSGGYH